MRVKPYATSSGGLPAAVDASHRGVSGVARGGVGRLGPLERRLLRPTSVLLKTPDLPKQKRPTSGLVGLSAREKSELFLFFTSAAPELFGLPLCRQSPLGRRPPRRDSSSQSSSPPSLAKPWRDGTGLPGPPEAWLPFPLRALVP